MNKTEILNTIAIILSNLQTEEKDEETKIALFDLSRNIGTYAKYYDELNPILAREMNRVARNDKMNSLKVNIVDNIDTCIKVNARIFEIEKERERE